MATIEVHKRVLFQIDIDIDLSKSPLVRDMFKRTEPMAEIGTHFKKNGIKIASTFANGGGTATHIEIQGPSDALTKFVDAYSAVITAKLLEGWRPRAESNRRPAV